MSRIVQQVREHARPTNPFAVLLALITLIAYAVGWTLGTLWRGVALTIGWVHVAALHGWRAARKSAP